MAPAGTTPPVFGRIFEQTLTEPPGASGVVTAQVGFGPVGSDPRFDPSWAYFPATFNTQVGNDDEYQGTMTVLNGGSYLYTYRFSLDGGASWSYADRDG